MYEARSEERVRERARPSRRFHATMTVAEAIEMHPQARWELTSWQFGGGGYCAISRDESLAEAAERCGIPLDRLLSNLNRLA
jgi:hypothetical protein